MRGPLDGKPDRTPATLPIDNRCSYVSGGSLVSQIGYLTKADYDLNQTGNHSTSRPDPADLPGGFYDKQGEVWFVKNGYYVAVGGLSEFREPVARLIVGKL